MKKQEVGQAIQNREWEVFQKSLFELNFKQRHRCTLYQRCVCSTETLSGMTFVQLESVQKKKKKINGAAFYHGHRALS